ncbi:hypothetical protein [Nitrosopumilus sp.]|uniref:hypothetical protein n=1 Tax=Nitrosopumilus sp. TaxID=2024843 RepID=UPI0026049DB4|nr:hypothetical protein [Nitrosopumilus sp.]
MIFCLSPAYAHKLISHDGSHIEKELALEIPDHKISWAIYDNLGVNEAKYYTFEAKKGDSFYASIVVPKIIGLEEYSPTMIVTNEKMTFTEKILYEGNFPSKEFYEPFGQVTYWERQEVNFELPNDGKYFIIVIDEKNQNGKYSLAVGTIEDFSALDFVTVLPTAWLQTKLFVNDFNAVIIFFSVCSSIILIPIIIYKIKKQKLVQTN